jgi:hypothetical protein
MTVEQRLCRDDADDEPAATRRRLIEAGKMQEREKVPVSLLYRWIETQWIDAVDNWRMLGEPVMFCEHIDGEAEQTEPAYWLIRYPDAVLCKRCHDLAKTAIRNAGPTACDNCGGDVAHIVTQEGVTTYAVAFLCRVCHGAAEVPALAGASP